MRVRDKKRWWQTWLVWACGCEDWYTSNGVILLSSDRPSSDECHEWYCGWTTMREVNAACRTFGGTAVWRTING